MTDREAEFRRERRSYLTGLAIAFVVTVIPFGVVAWRGWSTGAALWLIAGFALAQIVVRFRFFLHIDLSRQKREDLQLILFTILLLTIMAGGTIWVIANLYSRMMWPGNRVFPRPLNRYSTTNCPIIPASSCSRMWQ